MVPTYSFHQLLHIPMFMFTPCVLAKGTHTIHLYMLDFVYVLIHAVTVCTVHINIIHTSHKEFPP